MNLLDHHSNSEFMFSSPRIENDLILLKDGGVGIKSAYSYLR